MGASKNMISGECLDPVNDLCVVVSVSRKKVQEDVSQQFTSSAWSP